MKKTPFLATALALTLGACIMPDKTDTPKGTTIEHTDAGTKIDISALQSRTVKRIETTCGTKKFIEETKKFACPKLLKEYKSPTNPQKTCIDCEHEVDVVE